jgi:hypothetical protein
VKGETRETGETGEPHLRQVFGGRGRGTRILENCEQRDILIEIAEYHLNALPSPRRRGVGGEVMEFVDKGIGEF